MERNELINNVSAIIDDKYVCHFEDGHVEFRDLNDREVSMFMHIPDLYYKQRGFRLRVHSDKFGEKWVITRR